MLLVDTFLAAGLLEPDSFGGNFRGFVRSRPGEKSNEFGESRILASRSLVLLVVDVLQTTANLLMSSLRISAMILLR